MEEAIIIGAGPAGLSAGLYLARRRIEFRLFEESMPGGQLAWAGRIENYPGFPSGIEGPELAGLFVSHLEKSGGAITPGRVGGVVAGEDGLFTVAADKPRRARVVIAASGSRPVSLGVPGEERLVGRGVSYCAVCDGPLFRGRTVAVVGRGPRALGEARFLADLAARLVIVPLGPAAPGGPWEKIGGRAEREIHYGCPVTAINGEQRVTSLAIGESPGNEPREVPVDGVFIFAGSRPSTDFVPAGVSLSGRSFIRTETDMSAGPPGFFACGDCREKPLKQVVTACAEGALAAWGAARLLRGGRE